MNEHNTTRVSDDNKGSSSGELTNMMRIQENIQTLIKPQEICFADKMLEEDSNNQKETLTLPITAGYNECPQMEECASVMPEHTQDNTTTELIAEQSSCHFESNDEQGKQSSDTIIANTDELDNENLLTGTTKNYPST